MKVSELIALLQTYPPEAAVKIDTEEGWFDPVFHANRQGPTCREATIFDHDRPEPEPGYLNGTTVFVDGSPVVARQVNGGSKAVARTAEGMIYAEYIVIDTDDQLPETGSHVLRVSFLDGTEKEIDVEAQRDIDAGWELRFWIQPSE